MRTTRTPANLSESVQQRLNVYALAAGAAGVGMLALAQPSEAKVVYTPTSLTIALAPPSPRYHLDLNHDGVADFSLFLYVQGHGTLLAIYHALSNEVWGSAPFASALKGGVRLGSNEKFQVGNYSMWYSNCGTGFCRSGGQWLRARNRYLGFKFMINGETHYGWARLSINAKKARNIVLLTGYAYETIPNKPISTGQTKELEDGPSLEQPNPASVAPIRKPATLGHLAAGSPALSIWRPKEWAETTQ